MKEQEDCVAEEELDEITDSQVDPETEEVFVHLFKKSPKVCLVFFSSIFKMSIFLMLVKS